MAPEIETDCPHEMVDAAETGPMGWGGRTEVYLVCEDCGAEVDGPFAGSGVL